MSVRAAEFVANRSLAPLGKGYLLYGTQPYLVELCLRRLSNAAEKQAGDALEKSTFSGPAGLREAVLACRTESLFGAAQLVRVEQWWSGLKGDKSLVPAWAEWEQYWRHPAESNVVVFCLLSDKKSAWPPAGVRASLVDVDCAPLRGMELRNWIRGRIERKGWKLDPGLGEWLEERLGDNLEELERLLEVLELQHPAGTVLTREKVGLWLQAGGQEPIYELYRAMGERNLARSLVIAANLYRQLDHPVQLIAGLQRFCRQLLALCEARYGGYSAPAVAEAVGLSPYPAKVMASQAEHFTPPQVRAMLAGLQVMDYRLKTGWKASESHFAYWLSEALADRSRHGVETRKLPG